MEMPKIRKIAEIYHLMLPAEACFIMKLQSKIHYLEIFGNTLFDAPRCALLGKLPLCETEII